MISSYTCDRCGSTISGNKNTIRVSGRHTKANNPDIFIAYDADLCSGCFSKVSEVLVGIAKNSISATTPPTSSPAKEYKTQISSQT